MTELDVTRLVEQVHSGQLWRGHDGVTWSVPPGLWWSDVGTHTRLYCPGPVRDDPALGDVVNDRLVAWAEEVGIYPERWDWLRSVNFGRLAMLAHPDTDDPDRLLVAARCALAEWATDDYYCDDESAGASPGLLGSRLGLAYAVVDPVHLPMRYAPELAAAMRADPVLMALHSSFEYLARHATSAQVARLRHELAALFVSYHTEAGWRTTGQAPPLWEYLVNRQSNSFMPCLAVIDAVGGYEVPAAEYAQPQVRRTVVMAGTASVLLNDLYSRDKEERVLGIHVNLTALVAAEDRCSPQEAASRGIEVYNELMHTFEQEAAVLSRTGSPQLRRYLAGVWAWLGGSHEWHRGSARYHGGSGDPSDAV